MAQIVGLHTGIDQGKNNVTRSPLLSIPPAAYDNGRIMKPTGGAYVGQAVQLVDDLGNGAAHVRIAQGGYRTVMRILNISLNGDEVHKIRLPNNVGGGTLMFNRIDGIAAPTGVLKLLDDNAKVNVFILSPNMGMSLAPNMHRVIVQGMGCDANSYASVIYSMETYISNVIFDVLPLPGDTVSFGDFAIFEFHLEGEAASVQPGSFPVEIPASESISALCDNLLGAFNTAYIGAIEPVGSQVPYSWATKLIDADLIYYKDSADGWKSATDAGVQFNSINAALIRNTTSSGKLPSIQIQKQL